MQATTPENRENQHHKPVRRKSDKQTGLHLVLLALVVLLGGAFRFMGQNWDDFVGLHPDERFLTRNLLPLVGGGLEFTNNPDFAEQVMLVASDSTRYAVTTDVVGDASAVIGVMSGTTGADLTGWLFREGQIRSYDTPEAVLQAVMAGDVSAGILSQQQTSLFSGLSVRPIGTYTSQDVQRARCLSLNPDTNGAGGYFDTFCSPLNPHNAGNGFYTYGTLPLFMAHFAGEFVLQQDMAGSPIFDWQGTTLIWRWLSAFFDCGTIILIFLMGRRMHSGWVGLMAALLYAAAPLAIQKSHFGTVNAIAGFTVTLGIWAALGVQDRARLIYFLIFGVALGASVASRINTAPLAGVVVLAAMVHGALVLDHRLPWSYRVRVASKLLFGLALAAIVSIIAFRIFNPYAFDGPGFFGVHLNARWLSDITAGSYGVSGASDGPPNWQWVARESYFYPLRDMLLYGMGIAFGVVAWFGWAWAGWRILRGHAGAIRNILPFVWVLVYFAWMGRLWVMTMRYYLPLYSSLALLAGWALWALWRHAQRHETGQARFISGSIGAIFAAIPIYYVMFGQAQTPTSLLALVFAVILIAVAFTPRFSVGRALTIAGFVLTFTVLWGVMFTSIYRQLSPRVEASRWLWENISGDFSMEIEGAPEGTPLINVGIFNSRAETSDTREKLAETPTVFETQVPFFYEFVAPASGLIRTVYSPHIGDPLDDTDDETLLVSMAHQADENTSIPLAEGRLTRDFTRENHVLGDAYTITFDSPVEVVEGETYLFKAEALAGPLTTGGAVIVADEAGWDDPLTGVKVCTLPDGLTLSDGLTPGMVGYDECNGRDSWPGLIHSYKMGMSFPIDQIEKLDMLRDGLNVADYVVFTSNRFYDTVTRNRLRWPMSSAMYDAIFAGELGFDLVGVFQSQYELGPLSVSDQHLPIYDSPAWLNELEADEAFHVYDHPVVFIFKKNADYDPNVTEQILTDEPLTRIESLMAEFGEIGAQLVNVVNWTSLEADRAPTGLMMPEDVRQINRAGGTWSDRFDSDSLLNTNQVAGVAVWWLVLMVYGLISWPMLFAAFPRLADRGYSVAKFVSLLLIAWVAWMLGHLRFATWSQGGIIALMGLLALVNLVIAYRKRDEIGAYVRQHWGRLLSIEVITLILFLFMIAVRLSNPDIWHFSKGGEKPMDFAYFNAVLRSTVFPAYDPWHAGGYINYYYFGFVLMGSPVLLLKIVPAFAYNLVIPTVYALTGIGVFSAAFNIVASLRRRSHIIPDDQPRTLGNPWVAGIIAIIITIFVGNLDTVRVFMRGVADLGGYQLPQGYAKQLEREYYEQFAQTSPDGALILPPDVQFELLERIENINVFDNIGYEIGVITHSATSLVNGFTELLNGRPLPTYTDRWYWGPSRVLSETPGVEGNAITEMPMFTFIYGDLHAHMINLPVLAFIILVLFHEVKARREDTRPIGFIALAIGLLGISVGLIQAINTWDYPAFLLFSVIALGYAWWLKWERLNRWSVVDVLVYVGGFVTMNFIAALPHRSYYAATYGSIDFWQGGKTPLWAYFDIWGLFLFLIISMMVWETIRWWRDVKVKSLRGRSTFATVVLTILGLVTLFTVVAGFAHYQVALIVVPLILWIVPLFFRSGQSREMQYVLVVIGLALSMTLGVEIIVLGGDIQRQNTVFKFYMQAWMLFGVAGGVAAAWLVHASDYWSGKMSAMWYGVFMLLLGIAALYPLMGIRARAEDRMTPPPPVEHTVTQTDTLDTIARQYAKSVDDLRELNDLQPSQAIREGDVLTIVPDYTETPMASSLYGIEYMQYAGHRLFYSSNSIELQDDYAIIRWLQENVEGTPVILEGREAASEYTWTARIAINTGLPSVQGWNFHQRQQRTFDPLPRLVQQREENVKWFYNTGDIVSAVRMLRHYDVRYIIVSGLERANSSPEGLAKLDTMVELGLLDVVFEQGSGQIYAVNPDAMQTFALEQLAFRQAVTAVYEPLPAPPMSNLPVEAPTFEEQVADAEQRATQAAVTALLDYDITHIVIDNVPRLQNESPQAVRIINRLAADNVLAAPMTYRLPDGTPMRLIYTVNPSAAQAFSLD